MPPDEALRKFSVRPSELRALLALLLLFLGPSLASTGFYLDDWHLLKNVRMDGDGSFLDGARQLLARNGYFRVRALNPVYFAALTRLESAAGMRLVMLAEDATVAVLLFILLRRLTSSRSLALLAAALAFALPVSCAVHVWAAASQQIFSCALLLASLNLHLSWWERGRRSRRTGLPLPCRRSRGSRA